MAYVPISMVVTVYPKNKTDAPYPATVVGYAWITGLEVGGGPIIPPEMGEPPQIWGGGNVPMPNPPIANVPGAPGYLPPVDQPPPDGNPGPIKKFPPDGGWGYSDRTGWIYKPGPGAAGPKK